jgi:hypothetical protein
MLLSWREITAGDSLPILRHAGTGMLGFALGTARIYGNASSSHYAATDFEMNGSNNDLY